MSTTSVSLSDIGASSFTLPPEPWLSGWRAANSLAAPADRTRRGGALMMAGNLSLQGLATVVGGVFGWLGANGDAR